MTLAQFVSIIAARWKIMLLVLATVVAGTAVVNLVLPKSYLASGAVLIDVKSPDPIAGMVYPGMMSPSYMATQVDVIQSDRVSQRVVKLTRMDESAQMRDQWREATKGAGNFEVWVGDLLRKGLDVKPSRESNVININYKAADAKFATAMANAYAQAYIDVSLDMRVEPAKQYGKFFDERAKQLRERVEQARAKLTAFQRERGIVGSDERLDVENAKLNELSSQMVALQSLSSETSIRQAQANKSGDQIQEVINNGVIGNLKADISRSEARLKELKSRLGDNHPSVLEVRASLDELHARQTQETSRVSGGVGVSNAINQARLDQLRSALETQRVKVMHFKASRDELAVLAADVESAQRAYDGVNARSNQTELESRTPQTNVYVLNPASEPIAPASPRVALNMLLALFVGTLLATGVAMLMELFDRRVRSAAEVVQALDLPLLGRLVRRGRGQLFGRRAQAAQAMSAKGGMALAQLGPVVTASPGSGNQTQAVAGAALLQAHGVNPGEGEPAAAKPGVDVADRALGDIFRETRQLSTEQIDQILAHQQAHGTLFGESAVALSLVENNDVLWALSQQFHYPYAPVDRKQFNPELITATTPFSDVSETFRSIRSQLMRSFEHLSERRALAVVSADDGDGKTFVAANLAIAFSQLGRRTLLIDGNMRAPRLHQVFGIENVGGLSSILSGRQAKHALVPVADLPSLFILPVGTLPPNPLELLESPAFGRLIGDLLGKFDHVIVDTPSARVGADAGVIAARCGAFLSLALQGRTRMDSMLELVQSLSSASTQAVGFVLNEH
jgi:chain length determinant protein tyrosine kinase EpsG